jgi:hypothetical protein
VRKVVRRDRTSFRKADGKDRREDIETPLKKMRQNLQLMRRHVDKDIDM